MPGSMRLTFVLCLGAMTLLYLALWRLEFERKSAAFAIRALRRSRERRPEPLPEPAIPISRPPAVVAGR
jgi:hypothetical protein